MNQPERDVVITRAEQWLDGAASEGSLSLSNMIRGFLSLVRVVEQERDEWKRMANQSGEKHVSVSAKLTEAHDRIDELEAERDTLKAERKPWCQICGKEIAAFYCTDCHRATEPSLDLMALRGLSAAVAEYERLNDLYKTSTADNQMPLVYDKRERAAHIVASEARIAMKIVGLDALLDAGKPEK